MVQRTSKRPSGSAANRSKKPARNVTEIKRLAASILADPKAATVTQIRRLAASILADSHAGKPRPASRAAKETTLEDRLEAKATLADHADFSGPSLGEMSREQRHKLLYGE
jgi:hypothetical protein